MKKYVLRPITAIQFDGDNIDEIEKFINNSAYEIIKKHPIDEHIFIAGHRMYPNYYLVRVDFESIRILSEENFRNTYEEIKTGE